jgi:hypothetical protein
MQKHPATGIFDSGISLQQLINKLVDHSRPIATLNRSRVVNEVQKEVTIASQQAGYIPVMRELLTAVLQNSRDGQIYISADIFRGTITLQIEERNNYNGYALAYSVGAIQPDANNLGAHISIKGSNHKVAVITFSFPKDGAVNNYDC